jgi:quercetin dioxygenase-like cupin family protein
MEILNLQTEIGEGKDTEVSLLFDGAKRKIMQITLRQNAVLKAHQAAEPITIQCVTGTGDLLDLTKKETCKLSAGVLVTIEPEVIHEIRAMPEVSILLTKFKEE